MREYEIDCVSNFAKLQFYRVGLVTRFMTMKGREKKGTVKVKCRWNGLFLLFPGTDKSKRNTDDWFTPALRGFSWKQWEHREQGWDKSDNIFFGSIVTFFQRRVNTHTHIRTYICIHRVYIYTAHIRNVSTLRKPIHELRVYANSRKIQTMSRHCGRFYFLKNGRNTGVSSDVLPEDSNLRSRIFVLRFFLFHPSRYSSSYLRSILSCTCYSSFSYNINFCSDRQIIFLLIINSRYI